MALLGKRKHKHVISRLCHEAHYRYNNWSDLSDALLTILGMDRLENIQFKVDKDQSELNAIF